MLEYLEDILKISKSFESYIKHRPHVSMLVCGALVKGNCESFNLFYRWLNALGHVNYLENWLICHIRGNAICNINLSSLQTFQDYDLSSAFESSSWHYRITWLKPGDVKQIVAKCQRMNFETHPDYKLLTQQTFQTDLVIGPLLFLSVCKESSQWIQTPTFARLATFLLTPESQTCICQSYTA